MDDFLKILMKPDNMPVAGMLLVLIWLLWLWWRQARAHDKLIREGKKEEIAREMRK